MPHYFGIKTAAKQMDDPPHIPKPEPPKLPEAVKGRLDKVVESLGEVLPGQSMPMRLIEEHEDLEGKTIQAHMRGVYRFDEKNTKEACQKEIEDKLVDMEWYEIEYHKCNHSEKGNQPCEASEVVSVKES